MKRCSTCDLEKPFKEFCSDKGKDDGLCCYCNNCRQKRDYNYYRQHRESCLSRMVARRKKRRDTAREELTRYLDTHPCVDCGEKDLVVLDFDHITNNKEHEISRMITNGYVWRTILKEIEKCEVVCCNCHRRRTSKRGNWYKESLVSINGNTPNS